MPATRPYVFDLLRLAGPVALARLGIIAMAMTDVIVVGQLAPDELPHQALGWAPVAVFIVAGIGLLQGVQVMAARMIGEKNPAGAGMALKRGLVISIVAGLIGAALMGLGGERIFTTFGVSPELARPSTHVMYVLAFSMPFQLIYVGAEYFMEGVKKPIAGSIIMWLGNGVNLGLNLLWVPEYGVMGSAWATVVARVFLAAGILIWILCLRDGKTYGVQWAPTNGPNYRALLAVGFAACISQAVEAGAFSAMTVIAGRLGADAVAVYQILLNTMSVVFMVAMGLSAATAVLVSEAIGRKAPGDAARAGWTGLGLNTIGMLFCAGLFLAFPDAIGRAYTADLALAAIIAAHLWICALMLTPDGAPVVTAAALRARGDYWFPTFSHILAYAVAMPVLGYWLAEMQGMGVAGLIFAIFWASMLSAAVLVARWAFLVRPRS